MSSDKLKGYFLNILSKKDYSEGELRYKAESKGFEENEIEGEIEYLKQNNYLNDQKLAESIIDYYKGKKGERWLKQKMGQRKISDDIISQAFQGFSSEVSSDLKRQVESKYKIDNWKNLDFKTKQKVVNFLAYRGFSNPFDIIKDFQDQDIS